MTAWQTYWLLKLDEIQFILWIPLFLSIVNIVWAALSSDDWNRSTEQNELDRKRRTKLPLLYVGVICVSIACLIPSTGTMAAILVLPRIASSENLDVLQKDSADIYKLGIDRIKEVLEPKKERE